MDKVNVLQLGFLARLMFLSQQHNKSLWLVFGLAVAIKLITNRTMNHTRTGINSVAGDSKE